MAEEVVAVDSVTDVQSTVTHANEVDVIVIFLLLNQVGFDPVLDRLIGRALQDDDVLEVWAAVLSHLGHNGFMVHSWLHHSDRSQFVLHSIHDGQGLLQDFDSNSTAIEEDAEAVTRLDYSHVCVLQDCNSDGLLSQILNGRTSDSEVTKKSETRRDKNDQERATEGRFTYALGPLRPCMPVTMILVWYCCATAQSCSFVVLSASFSFLMNFASPDCAFL